MFDTKDEIAFGLEMTELENLRNKVGFNDKDLNILVNSFMKGLENDDFSKYTLKYLDNIGNESALTNDRGFLHNAYRKFRVISSIFNVEKQVKEYSSVLRSISLDKANPGGADVILDLNNIEALNETMRVMNALSNGVDDRRIQQMSREMNSDIKKMFWIYIGIAPFISLLALIFLWLKMRSMANSGLDELRDNRYVALVSDAIDAAGLNKTLNLTKRNTENDFYDTADILKVSSYIGKLRYNILPAKIKHSLKPDMFKSKVYINEEDKKEIINIISNNYQEWETCMGGRSADFTRGIRFIFNSAKVSDGMIYETDFGINTVESAYANLYTNMLLTYVDCMNAIVYVVQDARRY